MIEDYDHDFFVVPLLLLSVTISDNTFALHIF